MATMINLMLDQATVRIEQNPKSSAAKRRAVSAACYAAFHAVMLTCACEFLPNEDLASKEFERVYRGIDHGPMKNAFQANGPLKDIAALKEIGTLLVQLQDARMDADYAPPRPNIFTRSQVISHLNAARSVVSRLESLSDKERQSLAVHLLFQSRKK